MNIDDAVLIYEKNIRKLAEKNNVEYEVMLQNWKQKFEEFNNITDKYGFSEEQDIYSIENKIPFIALTVNGSILIVSEPDEEQKRKVRYQSIKIRTDDSKNVPEVFTAKLSKDVKLSTSVLFENYLETSPVIQIKSCENFDWDNFDKFADNITIEFTKKFEDIDLKTITKIKN